jgi:benzoate-CoA ligase family protein
MRDHTISIDASHDPATLEFAPLFNVAVSMIDRHLDEGRGDKVAIRSADEEVTYAALAENVNRSGNVINELGVKSGDRMLMIVKDCAAFFYLFLGAIKAGAVPVPINTLLRAKDYQFMIEDSACAVLVYSPEFAAEVEPAIDAATHKPDHCLLTEGGEGSFTDRLGMASAELVPAAATPMDDCFWLYSSGTTGNPKGTVHRHRDIPVTAQHYAVAVLGVNENDVCFSAAKLFFAYGLGNAMTFPLWVGATAVLFAGRPTPETTFETIASFKPSLYFGVPTLYAAQLQAIGAAKPDLSSLRLCISAGEALPPDILRRWQEHAGTTILDGIGSTEALHIFISNRAGDVKPGSTGRIVPGYSARVVDEDGNDVAADAAGQLMIKGDSNAAYYWNNPEKTAATMVDGWLNTGDTYTLDSEGYFHYGGRSDDMMKVGGIWCSPFEIEAQLVEHADVLEAAVVGRADDENLIKPEAFVVLNDPAKAADDMSAELLMLCKDGLARYKYPRWINFVEDLPKTATGKIQRFKLRST